MWYVKLWLYWGRNCSVRQHLSSAIRVGPKMFLVLPNLRMQLFGCFSWSVFEDRVWAKMRGTTAYIIVSKSCCRVLSCEAMFWTCYCLLFCCYRSYSSTLKSFRLVDTWFTSTRDKWKFVIVSTWRPSRRGLLHYCLARPYVLLARLAASW